MADAEEIVYKSYINQIDKIKHSKQRKPLHAEKVKRLNLQQGSSDESQVGKQKEKSKKIKNKNSRFPTVIAYLFAQISVTK